ncbi:trypsin-like serine protease [Sorangium sp. So ce269]
MRPRLIALACAALGGIAGCSHVMPGDPVEEQSLAIKNGRPATPDALFGAVAVLDSEGVQECSGVLISPSCVVTAAHCVVLQDEVTGALIAELGPANLRVAAGALDAADASPEQTFRVRKVVRHQDFPAPGTSGARKLARAEDIALLLLETPVTTMTPVPLVPPEELDDLLDEGVPVVIAGYGARGEPGQPSGALYVGETPFQQRSATEFSAGAPGSPDSCSGDSGGPACLMIAGEPHLLGISVRALGPPGGPDCGDGGIYTLVPAYGRWIEESADGEVPVTGEGATPAASFDGNPSGGCTVGRTGRPLDRRGIGAAAASMASAIVTFLRRSRARR